MNIVLDTNVIVAGLRSNDGASFQLLTRIWQNQLDFILSVPLLLEYEDVLKRPETMNETRLGPADVDEVLNMLCLRGKETRIHYLWRPQLLDAKDDMVLEAAVNGGAGAIITFNEKDFRPAATVWNVAVLTPGTYLRRLKLSETQT
jgi:putative PIN family toxin of toxin-antitoxin system